MRFEGLKRRAFDYGKHMVDLAGQLAEERERAEQAEARLAEALRLGKELADWITLFAAHSSECFKVDGQYSALRGECICGIDAALKAFRDFEAGGVRSAPLPPSPDSMA